MSKVAVVYWSATGNTEAMANAVKDGAAAAGADVTLVPASSFSAGDAASYDAFAFGCLAMGSEQLEESEFQPLWDSVKGSLGGKKTGLFGSWGWGNGLWMDSWKDDALSSGVNVVDTVIAEGSPDPAAIAACEDLGKALA